MEYSVINVSVVGPSYSGKTCLCSMLSDRKLPGGYISTIGVDCMYRKSDGITFRIWDTTGLQRFSHVTSFCLENSDIVIFCYSSSDEKSFQRFKVLYNLYEKNKTTTDVILVATKTDHKKTSKTNINNGKTFANKYNMLFTTATSFSKTPQQDLINALNDLSKKTLETDTSSKITFILSTLQTKFLG